MMMAGPAPIRPAARSQSKAARSTDPIRNRVGVVFQEASLFPWLSALDNIEFPMALRNAPREERRIRAT